MPEANQYFFNHREMVETMIKQLDIHEGKWMLLVNFNFTAGNFGVENNQLMPSVLASIAKIGVQRVDDPNAPAELVVDAASVNPPARKAKTKP